MKIIPILLKEMSEEAVTTRKMLAQIPADKYDWKPHPKSMSIRALASHIVDLPNWVGLALNTAELDFAAGDFKEEQIDNNALLLEKLEQSLAGAKNSLENATEDDLLPDWTLRNGEQIYLVCTKLEMIRTAFCQIVHHRAQLGVFLRLLDIPIPGSYGPSADEMALYDLPQENVA
ncbi:hypothetical protein GCM10023149_25720 [Mucilaginibacter gynuensis]|uniref:Damage-inducible protein DinB n=1 Tax=Mucilaginibacter gynuensis TaxID=1302236 RepID=A0ABP8GHL4_9SPHI